MRIPKADGYRTASGWFDSPEKLAHAAERYDGSANIYVTLNPVNPALMARANNRVVMGCKDATSDKDVLRRDWLFLDIDSVRPAGISSTEEELAQARALLCSASSDLAERGWPDPVVCLSGNGYYALYPIELPNPPEATTLTAEVLKALAHKYNSVQATIDTTVANASRIIGLVGTKKMKGEDMPDRPHRTSEVLSLPDEVVAVSEHQLRELVEELAPAKPKTTRPLHKDLSPTSLTDMLDHAGLDYREQPADANGVTWYHLRRCPFHADGRDFECGVGQKLPDGPLAGHCFHPEGEGKGWQDFKEALGLGTSTSSSHPHHQAMVEPARIAPSPAFFPRTDAGNAELFAHLHGERVRYDHRLHRYLLFADGRWQEDVQSRVRLLAKQTARHRLHLAAETQDDHMREGERKFARQSENKSRQEAMLTLAQAEEPISDDGMNWDQEPMLLGVGNGVLELNSGLLRAGRPEDRMTLHTPIHYDPDATCPRFERFLGEVFEGNVNLIEFISRAAGYSLTGHTYEQVFLFCYGSGANGKGILFGILRQLLGSYAQNLPFQSLELQSRGSIPNDIASIVDRRLVTVAETNRGVRLDEALLKTLTGEDVITARFMRQEFFNFQPQAKFWLTANHKPQVKDLSDGFWRRILMVPFTRNFKKEERDPHLSEKLKSELPGILAWAVRGCAEWQKRGLDAPPEVLAANEEYQLESDSLGRFISECCMVAPDQSTQAGVLFEAYRGWGKHEGLPEDALLDNTEFGSQLAHRFSRTTIKGRRTYRGVGLRP